jgi:hypothetical protein
MPKQGFLAGPEISTEGACVHAVEHPAYIWDYLRSGFCAEHGNPSCNDQANTYAIVAYINEGFFAESYGATL